MVGKSGSRLEKRLEGHPSLSWHGEETLHKLRLTEEAMLPPGPGLTSSLNLTSPRFITALHNKKPPSENTHLMPLEVKASFD